jgi:hypothetical protein
MQQIAFFIEMFTCFKEEIMQYEYVLNVASVFVLYPLYENNRSHAPTHVLTHIRHTLVW